MRFRRFLLESEGRLIVFHGTHEPIKKFEGGKQVSGYYPGFYTTINRDHTANFGSYVHEFDITDLKFFTLSGGKDSDDLKQKARKAGYWTSAGSGYGEAQYLKDLGYDGIRRGNEYIIFDPYAKLKL